MIFYNRIADQIIQVLVSGSGETEIDAVRVISEHEDLITTSDGVIAEFILAIDEHIESGDLILLEDTHPDYAPED
ncbi:MAG: hypothetical protein V3R57_06355 [Candidatus Bathyarchaeia archaeon]